MKVAVVGCGPAGLAATHAATGLGADVTVYAPKKKTPQRGPITLHRAIPGINNEQPEGYVRQIVIGGSILDYRLKLYGDVNIAINGDILEHGFPTWRVQSTYDKLWALYHDLIRDEMLTPEGLEELACLCDYDLVICTAPAPDMCQNKKAHTFHFKEIAVKEEYSYPHQPPNTVIYNAYSHIKWVRSSRIFDAAVTEWDLDDAPPGSLIIKKPLSHDCDCHPRVVREGRFGAWHNETWIDHAYFNTFRLITSMLNQKEWEEVK